MKTTQRRTWFEKLDKHLRHHLRHAANVRSRAALQRTVTWQAEKGIDCWECRRAARQAGLTVPDIQPHDRGGVNLRDGLPASYYDGANFNREAPHNVTVPRRREEK